jgi:type IV pilus assembly protein PilM
VAQLEKKNGRLSLRGYRREELPAGIIEDGEIKKPEELVEYIKKALEGAAPRSIRSKFVIYSIPETKGFIRVIRVKKNPEEGLENAVFAEIEQYFPINVGESYIDWQVLGKTGEEYDDILAAAVPQQLVDSYSAALTAAGLTPVAAEIESIAISRSLINEKLSQKPTLIIDLGKDRTGFIIFKAPTVQFTASIPICGDELVKAIAKKLKVSEAEAEALKEKCGLSDEGECQRVYEAMDASLAEMTAYIEKLLGYYHEHYKNEPDIAKVIICGGESRMEGVSSLLSLKIKKEVEKGNPWVNIISAGVSEIPSISSNDSLIFVTVLGLALRGIEEDNSI